MTVVDPKQVPEHTGSSAYPPELKPLVSGRHHRRLGEAAGLTKFDVNLVRLEPGAASSARHWHTREDEFVWVVDGEVTLITDAGPQVLTAGMSVGFPAGRPDGHHFVNRSGATATILAIGDRSPGDAVHYPDAGLELIGGVFRKKER
jgi:uncharacterized cupin superfamily protein